MRALPGLAVLVTAAACFALLVSCALARVPEGLACVAAPILFLVATYFLVAMARMQARSPDCAPDARARTVRLSGVACALLFVGTVFLLALDWPVRIAFDMWRSDFDKIADAYDPEDPYRGVGSHVGPYRIDMIAQDERGGLYIRVHEGWGSLERPSYGFARGANTRGTPFGNAGYAPTDLGGGWSWFAVNDDW